uniref:Uncharacterized protein n=1 Tax=Triticum urartu TaxID=4572 RepID=A0A8R7U482_TRIUA
MALPSHPSVKGGRPRRTAAFFLPPALAPQLKPNIHHHCRWFGSATVVKHLLCRARLKHKRHQQHQRPTLATPQTRDSAQAWCEWFLSSALSAQTLLCLWFTSRQVSL